MVAIGALVLLLNVLVLDPKSAIGGYRLEDRVLPRRLSRDDAPVLLVYVERG
jgi:hypothetical protein